MPSARQLLEQADALMRRNRKRGKGKGNGPPTLTDALTSERTGTLAPTIILPEAASSADPIVNQWYGCSGGYIAAASAMPASP